jgi:hypothetical protein
MTWMGFNSDVPNIKSGRFRGSLGVIEALVLSHYILSWTAVVYRIHLHTL